MVPLHEVSVEVFLTTLLSTPGFFVSFVSLSSLLIHRLSLHSLLVNYSGLGYFIFSHSLYSLLIKFIIFNVVKVIVSYVIYTLFVSRVRIIPLCVMSTLLKQTYLKTQVIFQKVLYKLEAYLAHNYTSISPTFTVYITCVRHCAGPSPNVLK